MDVFKPIPKVLSWLLPGKLEVEKLQQRALAREDWGQGVEGEWTKTQNQWELLQARLSLGPKCEGNDLKVLVQFRVQLSPVLGWISFLNGKYTYLYIS